MRRPSGGEGIGSNSDRARAATIAAPPKMVAVRISGFICGQHAACLEDQDVAHREAHAAREARPFGEIRPAAECRAAGDQSIVIAPASDSAARPAPGRVRRSCRMKCANSAVHAGRQIEEQQHAHHLAVDRAPHEAEIRDARGERKRAAAASASARFGLRR